MPRPARLPPYEKRDIRVGTVGIHLTELPGDGPPLMLLHGIGMDWRVWQGISRRLHPYFHLYLPDLRGHGGSDKPQNGYTLPHYAADVEDVIDELGLSSVLLVGSSLGGMVATVVEAPSDIVAYRVLVDPPLTGGPIRDEAMFREILRLKHEPSSVLVDFLQRYNPGAGRHYLQAMSEMWHSAADGVILDMLASPDDYYAVDRALTLIDAPTLLMRADPRLGAVLDKDEAERAIQLLPHGREVTVPGAGHAIHAYSPEDFTRILLDFTRRTPALK